MLRVVALGCLAVLVSASLPAAADPLPIPEMDGVDVCTGAGQVPAAQEWAHELGGQATAAVEDAPRVGVALWDGEVPDSVGKPVGEALALVGASLPPPFPMFYAALGAALVAMLGSGGPSLDITVEIGPVLFAWGAAIARLGVAVGLEKTNAALAFAHAVCTA